MCGGLTDARGGPVGIGCARALLARSWGSGDFGCGEQSRPAAPWLWLLGDRQPGVCRPVPSAAGRGLLGTGGSYAPRGLPLLSACIRG